MLTVTSPKLQLDIDTYKINVNVYNFTFVYKNTYISISNMHKSNPAAFITCVYKDINIQYSLYLSDNEKPKLERFIYSAKIAKPENTIAMVDMHLLGSKFDGIKLQSLHHLYYFVKNEMGMDRIYSNVVEVEKTKKYYYNGYIAEVDDDGNIVSIWKEMKWYVNN